MDASAASPAPAAPASSPSRPPVVDLAPHLAAKQVAPDKPCPVCGAWLEKTTASGATAGLPGVPQPAARCATCNFHSGPLVTWSALLIRMAGFILASALAVKIGLGLLHTKPPQGIVLLLLAPLPAVWAWIDARRPGKRLAQRIAHMRA